MEWNEPEKLSELELDDLLREWKVADPPSSFRLAALPEKCRYRRWAAPLIAACLAAAAIAIGLSRHTAAPPSRAPIDATVETIWGSFEQIPYTIPLSKNESAAVVRMRIPVTALLAAGFQIPATDPTAVVAADVLVGADGRPHGIRLVSAISKD